MFWVKFAVSTKLLFAILQKQRNIAEKWGKIKKFFLNIV